ncbi:MAG: hypothetical protein WB985_20515 [Candidatus Acidiferrales bacterium]
MVLLGKIALGVFGTMVAGVGLICSEGMIEVNVVEKGAEPHHVFVLAPAALVPVAAHFVPANKLGRAARELKPWMPTVRAALEGLDDTADVTLVDVTQPGEHVVVRKEGGSVVVNVVDHDENVYVSTPIRAIESTVEQVAYASDRVHDQDSGDFQ